MELEINLGSKLEFDNLESFIQNYSYILNPDYCLDKLIFNANSLKFISPSGFCVLSSMIRYAQYLNLSKQGCFFTRSSYIDSYFDRMNFYEIFGLKTDKTRNRNDCSSKLLELKPIDMEDRSQGTNLAGYFNNIIKKQLNGDSEILDSVSYSIGEIIDNVIRHSMSPTKGFICAQTYARNRRLEICISDCGVGIANSLRNDSIGMEDAQWIEYAIEKGVSSKLGMGHTGEGLFFTSEFIKENRGRMKIISGKGAYLLDNSVYLNDISRWKGTIVALEFQLDNPVNVKDIFDRECPLDPEGVFDLDAIFN